MHLERPKTYDEAREAIKQYIAFYNKERFQQKFGGLSAAASTRWSIGKRLHSRSFLHCLLDGVKTIVSWIFS